MIQKMRAKVVWAVLGLLFVSFITPLIVTSPVAAADSYVWQGDTQVTDTTTKDAFSKPADVNCAFDGSSCQNRNFSNTGALPNCSLSQVPNSITADTSDAGHPTPWPSGANKVIQVSMDISTGSIMTTAPAKLFVATSGNGTCNVATSTITIGTGGVTGGGPTGGAGNADYAYVGTDTIRNVQNGKTFKKTGNGTIYNQTYGAQTATCPDNIKLPSVGATTGTLNIATDNFASSCEYNNRANNDNLIGPLPITISKTAPASIPPDPASQTDAPDSCTVDSSTAMRWLVCDMISLGQSTIEAVDRIIQDLLFTPTDQIFTPQFKTVWNSFRVLGVVLVLLAGLVMIISQAAGLELFDAYTIKKLLPRLLVAAIGISLSWPLMQLAVTFFNDIGGWTYDLILAPFGGLINHAGGAVKLGATLLVLALPVTVVVLGAFGSVMLLGTLALGILVGLLVLTLRQLVILTAVLIAPLAIAAYVLPGTQKLWAFWKNTFLTSLLMFPIITGFIAAGKALALVAAAVPDSKTMHLVSVLAYIAPYFMLPFAFKLAGGLMSTIFSIANDRNKGAFDRLKKGRQAQASKNFSAMRQGNRYRGNSGLARTFNRGTRGAAVVASGEAGINPGKWRRRVSSAISRNTLDEAREAVEKNPYMRNIAANDDFLLAALNSKGDENAMRKELEMKKYEPRDAAEAAASMRAAKRSMSNEAFETAAALALPATGTAFKTGGAGEMHDLINSVAGDDRNRAASMLAAMRSGAMGAKRFDLAGGGFGEQLTTLQAQKDKTMTTAQGTETTLRQSLEGQGGGYIAAAKKSAVQNFAPVIVDNVQRAAATGDVTRTAHELAKVAGRYDAMASVSPENADVLAHQVMAKEITYQAPVFSAAAAGTAPTITGYTTKTATIREAIEDWRGTGNFQEMRREYQNAAVAGASASAAAAAATAAGMPPPPTAGP